MRLGRAAASFEEEDDERLTFTRTNNVRLQQGRGGRGRGGYASLLQKATGGTAVSAAEEGDEVVVEESVATGEAVVQESVAAADEQEDWQAEVRRARRAWLQREEPLIEDSDLEDSGSSDEDEPASPVGGTAGFIAAPTFDGPRPGYSFKADAQGVGYYRQPASGGGGGGGGGGGSGGGGALHGAPASFVETEAEVLHTRLACILRPSIVHPSIIHPPLTGVRLLGRSRWQPGRCPLSGRRGGEPPAAGAGHCRHRRYCAATELGRARARARRAHGWAVEHTSSAALDRAAAASAVDAARAGRRRGWRGRGRGRRGVGGAGGGGGGSRWRRAVR